jgi:cytochrome c
MIRFLVLALALGGLLLGGGNPAHAQAKGTETVESDDMDWQGLVPGKGREETFYMCSSCHSAKLVVQQGLSRERWEEVFVWMVKKQAMPPLEPNDRVLILDYLTKHYNENRRKKRRRYIP